MFVLYLSFLATVLTSGVDICPDDKEYYMKSDAYQYPDVGYLFLDKLYHEWWFFTLNSDDNELGLAFGIGVTDPGGHKHPGSMGWNVMAYTEYKQVNDSYAPLLFGAEYPISKFHANTDNATLSFPGGGITVIEEGIYQVVIESENVTLSLRYEKRVPTAHEEMFLPKVALLSWQSYMPSAMVSGTVKMHGKEYTIKNANGYHDKNWGAWPESIFNWIWSDYSDPIQELGIVWGAYRVPMTQDYIGYMFVRYKDEIHMKSGTLCLNPFHLQVLEKKKIGDYEYASHIITDTEKNGYKITIEIKEHVAYENPGGAGLNLIVFEMMSWYDVVIEKDGEVIVKSSGYGFNEWSDMKKL